MATEYRVGTSGWHYQHWRGRFYPESLPAHRWLEFYFQHFDTVEINNSFYKLPSASTFDCWKRDAPAGFIFAVKGSRYITHNKKLKDPEDSFNRFHDVLKYLGRKRGPILFQLPPSWRVNVERLENFLRGLPARRRYAFEFRNATWDCEEIYAVLRRYNAAYCIYDLGGRTSPLEVTADFAYIRLHGPGAPYTGSYHGMGLDVWYALIRSWTKLKTVYVYFDNDQAANAVRDALELKEMLKRAR